MSKVADHFDSAEAFETLLGEAEENANGDWAVKFIEDMKARFSKYKSETFISEKQLAKLQQLAQGETNDHNA